MDWSKTKTILILAFLTLNLFLADQLFQARTEQSQDVDLANHTQQELKQMAKEKHIALKAQIPTTTPQVNYLEARTINKKEPWKANLDGCWTRIFDPPVTASGSQHAILARYVTEFGNYALDTQESSVHRQVYYQQWNQHPIFDSPLIAVWTKPDQLASIKQCYFQVDTHKATENPQITAYMALISLIEKEYVPEGATIKEIKIGYHGQSYDAEIRVLPPVWRVRIDHTTLYINAFDGRIESQSNS